MQTSKQLEELKRLQQLLSSRDGKTGYKANAVAIRQRIAALENEQALAIGEPLDAA